MTSEKIASAPLMWPTNIDRRQCHREVPMKVLCLGYSRTGTLSLQAALQQLGYHDVYHFKSMVYQNPRDCDMWLEALNAKYLGQGAPFGKKEFDQLLGHCEAITDVPCAIFWRELLDAYPDAKVILTVRDADFLHRSYMNTLAHVSDKFCAPTWNPYKLLYRAMAPKFTGKKVMYLQFKHFFGFDFAQHGKQRYLEHNDAIRKAAHGRDFLEFQVKDGWAPLCKFLEKEVPATPFPRGNESAGFFELWEPAMKGLDGFASEKMGLLACAMVAGLAVALYRWL